MLSISVAVITAVSIATIGYANELEIQASLHGYNLLWPTGRCCNFDLVLNSDGKGLITIYYNNEERRESQGIGVRSCNIIQ